MYNIINQKDDLFKTLNDWNIEVLSETAVTKRFSRLLEEDEPLAYEICEIAYHHAIASKRHYKDYLTSFKLMCISFLKEQMYLERNGHYRYSNAHQAYENTLGTSEQATIYLEGLLMSQAFWPNHRSIIHFFRQHILNISTDLIVGHPMQAMEIPLGTGFFLSDLLTKGSVWKGVGYDLTPSSICFSAITHTQMNCKTAELTLANIFNLPNQSIFDLIICGEFIEHIDNPDEALVLIKNKLKDHGRVFLTTAIWAASPDHVYLFRSASEVRTLLEKYFTIEHEIVLAVDPSIPTNKEKHAMNYAAILKNQQNHRR